ncbi:Ig-like domain-containing protein [Planctomonas deserti]|uniref:Ig-like domain-containing protein n=1 Tax=Planctomonas deserti TaxID=2144185 RepID=UPI00131EFDB9|nr:Ig-like domain-containing protein [Planctomonas deserti]
MRARATAVMTATLAVVALALLPTASAVAAVDTAAAPTPTPAVPQAPAAPATPVTPVITDFPREVVKNGSGEFAGTKAPGSDVHLLVGNDDIPYCETAADQRAASAWTCTATELPSGQSIDVRALAAGGTSASPPATIRVLNAPVLRGTAAGVITGTSVIGATVAASSSNGSRCTPIPWSDTSWSCVLDPVPASGAVTVTATQQTPWSDGPSAASTLAVVIDSTAPAPPTVTTPTPGAQVPLRGTTYTGTGEEGATVDLYQSVFPVCSTVVRGGTWSCSGGRLVAGENEISVLQRDMAGNASPAVTVRIFAGQAPTAVASPTPTPSASSLTPPARPTPTATPAAPSATPAAPQTDEPASPEETPQGAVPPAAGGGSGDGSGGSPARIPDTGGGWSSPSSFGSALDPLPDAFAGLRWLSSLGIALGILILVILPAVLLQRSLAGRVRVPALRLAGRNQPSHAAEPANRWLVAAASLAGAAGLVAASLRVDDQQNFLRLLLATGLGLAIVNFVGVVLVAHAFRRLRSVGVYVRLAPVMLLISVVAVLLSRIAGLVPPLIVGQVLGFALARETTESERTRVALVQAGALTLLSLVAWSAYTGLGSQDGFWSSLTSETLSTVTLAGISSAVLALLPLGAPLGRSLLRGTVPLRLGATIVVLTIGTAALASTGARASAASLLPLTVTAVVFAALSVATWVWIRYVEPQH